MRFLLGAVFMSLVCLVASVLHYTHKAYGNHLTWIGWLAGMILLLLAFCRKPRHCQVVFSEGLKQSIKKNLHIHPPYNSLFRISFVEFQNSTMESEWSFWWCFLEHLWSKRVYFSSEPFQGAFWRDGSSSAKGVIFHYYITILFMVFGYNTLVFNLAVMLLEIPYTQEIYHSNHQMQVSNFTCSWWITWETIHSRTMCQINWCV